jgi:hypothetical protein
MFCSVISGTSEPPSALSLWPAGVGYGSFKKTALNEAVSLAQTRKELILILESDKAKLELRNKELERENERLEKKNLRLQDENKE